MKLRNVLMGAAASALCASAALAERGSDGQVNILYWQAVSIMTPYLSSGTKDIQAASLVIEPLARYNEKGEIVPYLVDAVPTVENGGVSQDLLTITWKLKDGLLWSDGSPVTADDVVFTWQYCTDPDGGCAQISNFSDVTKVEAVDPQTVKVTFGVAKPFPYGPFVGQQLPDPAEEAVRRLPRRQGPDLHRGEHQADRHRAVRGDRLQGQRRGDPRGQPELPRPGEAGLRHPRSQGRRRRGERGALGARDRRVRLCVEHPGRARDPRADGRRREGRGALRLRHRSSSASRSTRPTPTPPSAPSARRWRTRTPS